MSTIKADIVSISALVTTLLQAGKAFPATGGTLPQALAIHTTTQAVDTAVNQAIARAKAVPSITEEEGQSIIVPIRDLKPKIIEAVNLVISRKPVVDSLVVVAPLALQDLKALSAHVQAYQTILINLAPASLKSEATTIAAAVNAALAKGVAAYS